MKITFVINQLSHQSPGSFYRPYEMAKNIQNFGNECNILTPYKEDVKNYSDVPLIELPNVAKKQKNYSFSLRFIPENS